MAADRVEAITALLVETMEAHGTFEETELNGVYDQEWARWYSTHAVDHGLTALLGHPITADQLAQFLATSNSEFEQAEPKPGEPWAAYTARRIVEEL
jgi:hypothetical protein